MRTLFAPESQIPLVPFLERHAERLILLCDPAFVVDLHYAQRQEPRLAALAMRVEALDGASLQRLGESHGGASDGRLRIVADPYAEAATLGRLRRDFPSQAFLGLAEDVVPALLARADSALFEPAAARRRSAVRLLLLVTTPQSGADAVAGCLERLGMSRPEVHLSDTLIELFASGYVFDKVAALETFLGLAARDGWVATRLSTPLLRDFVETCGLHEVLLAARELEALFPIFLDRADRAAQAVICQRIAGIAAPDTRTRPLDLDLPAMLEFWLSCRVEGAFLDGLRGLFPHRLDLLCETDLADPERLAGRLAGFLGVPRPDHDRIVQVLDPGADEAVRHSTARFAETLARTLGGGPVTTGRPGA